MLSYIYPSQAELTEIEQEKLPTLTVGNPIFEIMPIENKEATSVQWEQKDNYKGLQELRGMNGKPTRVQMVGSKRFKMEPGVYGEFIELQEEELMTRRKLGTFGTPINIDDLVMDAQDQLLERRLARLSKIGWDLLQGTFTVSSNNGLLHTDSYATQTFASSTVWSNQGSSTPLADFRAVRLLQRGKSVSFGSNATAYMNQTTYNYLLANTNTNDIAGKRLAGLSTPVTGAELETIMLGDNLPKIRVVDDGYLDDDGNFQLYIPDGKVILVGYRPGVEICNYVMTKNINNPDEAAGAYTKTIVRDNEVPLSVEVHDGHNGGPKISFPSAIVNMTVA